MPDPRSSASVFSASPVGAERPTRIRLVCSLSGQPLGGRQTETGQSAGDQDVGGHLGHPAGALEPEQWPAKHRIDPAEVA
ncbi:hypothetical protein [Nonomuraea sp. NPDC001699]